MSWNGSLIYFTTDEGNKNKYSRIKVKIEFRLRCVKELLFLTRELAYYKLQLPLDFKIVAVVVILALGNIDLFNIKI